MDKYKIVGKLGDGSFGSVVKAQNISDKSIVAIKQMKQKYKSWDECMELREVKALRKLKDHVNIIKLREVIRANDELAFIFDFMPKDVFKLYDDAKKLGKGLSQDNIKSIFWQIANALQFSHRQGFFHRDLKPENLLMSDEGVVKLCDFGLAREIRSRPPYTDYVSTRWYRAPEILLRSTNYSSPVDIFALGCIIAELYEGKALFPGSSELDQLQKLCSILGTPSKEEWPEGYKMASQRGYNFRSYSSISFEDVVPNAPYEAQQLIRSCLEWDPKKRPTATKILQNSYFKSINSILPKEVIDAQANGGIVQPNQTNKPSSSSSNSNNNNQNSVQKPTSSSQKNQILNDPNSKRVLGSRENKNRENLYGKYDLDDINNLNENEQKNNNSNNNYGFSSSLKKPPLYSNPSSSRPPLHSDNSNSAIKPPIQTSNYNSVLSKENNNQNQSGPNSGLDTIYEFLNKDVGKKNQYNTVGATDIYDYQKSSGDGKRNLYNSNNNEFPGNQNKTYSLSQRIDYPSTLSNNNSDNKNNFNNNNVTYDYGQSNNARRNQFQSSSPKGPPSYSANKFGSPYLAQGLSGAGESNSSNYKSGDQGGYSFTTTKDRQNRATSLQQNNNIGLKNLSVGTGQSYGNNASGGLSYKPEYNNYSNGISGGSTTTNKNTNVNNNDDILGQFISGNSGQQSRNKGQRPGNMIKSALEKPSGGSGFGEYQFQSNTNSYASLGLGGSNNGGGANSGNADIYSYGIPPRVRQYK